MIPAPVIEERDGLLIVRDDLIEGGTKRRVLDPMMAFADEFVYASPASGYAQIALAVACRERGKRATVFTAKRREMHVRTKDAYMAGAKIIMIPYGYLNNVQAQARAYAEAVGGMLLPFGFDSPALVDELSRIARNTGIQPREVWSVAGSGVLTRALQLAFPSAQVNAVRIGKEPNAGRARLYLAPEAFERDAQVKPPFPSCSNYDAKAWRFIKQHASADALFWNVAA